MIYLIITSSLLTTQFQAAPTNRINEYLSAIPETLYHLPPSIRPIIVENNGDRTTCLEQFVHDGQPVPVVYTTNNTRRYKSKGVNELLDLHAVIHRMNIQGNDIIIKVTGRYSMLSSTFFDKVIACEAEYDAFIKFFNVCDMEFQEDDCVLGVYAIRAYLLRGWNPYSIDNYSSAEVAFARYVRRAAPRIKEMDTLDVRCVFAEDGRILDV